MGEPVIDHVERVASAVPESHRPLAYLHDVLERSDSATEELFEHGLTPSQFAVLDLLTRAPNESYKRYVMRIARARGAAGRIARTIKLADLDDHLHHRSSRTALPNYSWAREQLVAAASAHGHGASIRAADAA